MPPTSRFQIAKPDIVAHLDGLDHKVLRGSELSSILDQQRDFWRLAKSTTLTTFISDLTRKTKLRELRLAFRRGPVHGWTWGEIPLLEALQQLVDHSHYSHYTAVRIHGLTEQLPKTIYLTQERPLSRTSTTPSEAYAQEAIDSAFQRPPRLSNNELVHQGIRFVLLSGANHDELGVTTQRVNWGGSQDLHLKTTSLERTLIDIAVRPFYAGGVAEVAKAFANARQKKFSVNKLSAMLEKMALGYPYHQAIGYYMERAGYDASRLDLLRRFPQVRDFYLTHQMGETEYVKSWRLYVPKGF